MSISGTHPIHSLLTPPQSPGGVYCLSRCPSVIDLGLDIPSEYGNKGLFFNTKERTLPGIRDTFRERASPPQSAWLDGEVFSLSPISDFDISPDENQNANASNADFFRRRPQLIATNTSSSSRSNISLRSPDRFLPSRSPPDAISQRYHASKELDRLSTVEKLLRRDSASLDAFGPRRRVISPAPIPISRTPEQISRSLHIGGPTVLNFRSDSSSTSGERPASLGSIWTVGGLAPSNVGISNGRGGLTGSGTNAPLYTTSFSSASPKADEDRDKHEGRLAKALELDRTRRLFNFTDMSTFPGCAITRKHEYSHFDPKTFWSGTEWIREGRQISRLKRKNEQNTVNADASDGSFQIILDAPNLRDDFYCSILAYSPTCHTLVVGLGCKLYAWSEKQGVHLLNAGSANESWLTSISFSSTQGCKSILAFGRSDGTLALMSLYDRPLPRFEVQQPCPIACITWRPTISLRQSRSHVTPGALAKIEDLIVGDETGNVYYYSVEWPEAWEVDQNGWSGVMTLLARISIHSQQICGLAWSCDGTLLATGGNDNLCCLFRASRILQSHSDDPNTVEQSFTSADGVRRVQSTAGQDHVKVISTGAEKHRWIHGAAVKAIAFCPWRDSLVATGGGSNDKCIHFFHTVSGACLATISVAAQVTSLIWSTTRREIVATFGYAQPEHPYRIAVFSWPDCKQVAAIPWEGEHRALYAIPYPGGPSERRSLDQARDQMSRTAQEGCIVVAASDESVKFHEVWSAGRKATVGGEGLLGGSDILEGLEGIDKEGEVIR